MKKLILLLSLFIFISGNLQAQDEAQVLPEYAQTSGVSGVLSSVGSDSLANLMSLWAESFQQYYPNVNIQIQAAGSATAPPALIESTAILGPMSRTMRDRELNAFENRFGYVPVRIAVAIDALAVYVNKDNPVTSLTIPQLDAVFSNTRNCGSLMDISQWGQLGLTGPWENRRLQVFGRNSISGTYAYFREKALCKGDFKNTVNEQPGSASVVQAVGVSLNGIGYSGIGYSNSDVRPLSLARTAGDTPVPPTSEFTVPGDYPLARFLYIYVNMAPGKPLPPLTREFLKMVLSAQGQALVTQDGYIPLPASVVKQELAKVEF